MAKYCVYCGNPLKSEDKFCIICGKPVLASVKKPEKPDVEKAKDTIRNSITFFGLLSKFDEFTDICSNVLDWDTDIQVPRAKVNKHRPDSIPEKTIEVVKEYNRKDIELYKWAQEHYEKRKEEWEAGIQEKTGSHE